MNLNKRILGLSLVLVLILSVGVGCKKDDEVATDAGVDKDFTYSTGINEAGLWEGVTALEHVTLPKYIGIEVPKSVHTISDEDIAAQIDIILANYSVEVHITDREVIDNDTVNIDYVGSVDGEEFEGGTTHGTGTNVTIGVTSYIDDFLEQLIGREPGETFDIEVTFPEDYGQDHLNGKDAVFVTTINYIVEEEAPVLNDQFVIDKLSENFDFSSVADMKLSIQNDLRSAAVSYFTQNYLLENSEISNLPDKLLSYSRNNMVLIYQEQAAQYGMELEAFLQSGLGVASVEELFEMYEEQHIQNANMFLVIQAVAEDAEIKVEENDIAEYFSAFMNIDDYSEFEEHYGLPYLTLNTLHSAVLSMIEDNVILE